MTHQILTFMIHPTMNIHRTPMTIGARRGTAISMSWSISSVTIQTFDSKIVALTQSMSWIVFNRGESYQERTEIHGVKVSSSYYELLVIQLTRSKTGVGRGEVENGYFRFSVFIKGLDFFRLISFPSLTTCFSDSSPNWFDALTIWSSAWRAFRDSILCGLTRKAANRSS